MDSTILIPESSSVMKNNPESFKKTGLGERLKSVRNAMQLTEKEAAARLHLNVNIISLIENENFMDGPPAAFMRGYLRSYAKLLNLPENEITLLLKDLEQSIPSCHTVVPVIQIQPRKHTERYFRWLTYVVILILVVLVSVWWSSHSRYVIADVPPVQSGAAPQPTTTALQNSTEPANLAAKAKPALTSTAAPPATLTPSAITTPRAAPSAVAIQPSISQKIPEPTISVTPADQSSKVSTATKPAKKAISNMDMALPEPGADNDQE